MSKKDQKHTRAGTCLRLPVRVRTQTGPKDRQAQSGRGQRKAVGFSKKKIEGVFVERS